MKKNVKGFTLIELIVVIAIFSIIMAAATSLITPVSKTIVLADVRDEGSALVTNISDYIEGQLSTAEYLSIKNDACEDSDGHTDENEVRSAAKSFMELHYNKLLRSESTATSPKYASGIVHVMVIDNQMDNGAGYAKGRIKHYTYSADFGNISGTLKQETKDEWAVNKVYYNKSKEVQIKFGNFDTKAAFDAADGKSTLSSFSDSLSSISSRNTDFTISVTSERKVGISEKREYNFLEHASFSMVNIYNRVLNQHASCPKGTYYFVQDVETDGTKVPTIVDLYDGLLDLSEHGLVRSAILTSNDGANDGYCIVYSFTNEIDTKKS